MDTILLYDITTEFITGKQNTITDAPSRTNKAVTLTPNLTVTNVQVTSISADKYMTWQSEKRENPENERKELVARSFWH